MFPLSFVFDKISQVKTLLFNAADNVFSLSAIAEMPDDVVDDFKHLVLQPSKVKILLLPKSE